MIRGGEGLIWNALLPRAALAGDSGHSQVPAVTHSLALGYCITPLQG